MTDKQIIIDGEHDMNYCEDNNCKHYGNKEECKKTHCYYRFYSKLYTELKAKELECEELTADTVYLRDRVGKLERAILRRNEQLDNLKKTLTEIKPILELYANSKVGEEQLDGTYKITVKESKVLGDTYITFDPRPAKQALQKISEVIPNEN